MRATSLARADTQVRSWVLIITVAPWVLIITVAPSAICTQAVQDIEEAMLSGWIQAVHRFVEEEDGRVRGDGAGEEGAAALTAGEFADGALPQMGQVYGIESCCCGRFVGFVVPAKQAALGG